MNNVFEIEKLNFFYDNFKISIDKLVIAKNDKIAVLGENGCGKTTFLNLISGYKENFKGKIKIFGQNIKDMAYSERARKLSYLSQFANISFGYTIYETILFGRFPYLKGDQFQHEDYLKTEQLIEEFNLKTLRNRRFTTLSGGERRKVMVAKTLNQETELILLDEPTNMIDIKFSLFILKKVTTINATVIATIHDVNLALQFFNRFLFMKNGKIIYDLDRKSITEEVLYETYEVNFNQVNDFFIPEH